mgnify:CR=1 FL=1
MKTTLVVLAAGIGSRFGGGIKQLTPMGPNGEIIMDYAIYDAKRAGFDKVVFIIRKDLEQDFKSIIGDRIAKVIETDYAFQEIDDLPAGFSVPEGRKKPWGTGQALLSVRGKVKQITDAEIDSAAFEGALFEGEAEQLKALNQRLVKRNGPIVNLQGLTPAQLKSGQHYGNEILLAERSISINTAAAGGNASLMTMA